MALQVLMCVGGAKKMSVAGLYFREEVGHSNIERYLGNGEGVPKIKV